MNPSLGLLTAHNWHPTWSITNIPRGASGANVGLIRPMRNRDRAVHYSPTRRRRRPLHTTRYRNVCISYVASVIYRNKGRRQEVDMKAPLLPVVILEIDADLTSFERETYHFLALTINRGRPGISRSSSDGSAICNVLPVVCMTSCFHIM